MNIPQLAAGGGASCKVKLVIKMVVLHKTWQLPWSPTICMEDFYLQRYSEIVTMVFQPKSVSCSSEAQLLL